MVAGINHRRFAFMAAALLAGSYGPPIGVDVQAERRRREADAYDAMLASVSNHVMPAAEPLLMAPKPVPDRRGQAALSAAEAKRARRNAKRVASLPSPTVTAEGN